MACRLTLYWSECTLVATVDGVELWRLLLSALKGIMRDEPASSSTKMVETERLVKCKRAVKHYCMYKCLGSSVS